MPREDGRVLAKVHICKPYNQDGLKQAGVIVLVHIDTVSYLKTDNFKEGIPKIGILSRIRKHY